MSNMSNPSIKKNKSGFSKVFNRSKTDWDHNFVGDKYIKRIKY